MRAPLVLLLLAIVGFWPQLSFPEWRGTEGRRVQIAFEMVESGDYMVPTLGHEVTLAKPPLQYWVLAAVMVLAGADDLQELDELDRRWLRLPSVLAFWGLAWLVYQTLRSSHGSRAGWISAMGILLSPVILHEVPTAEIDPLFTCATVASVLLLARGVSFGGRGFLLGGGIVGGVALLTKGPPYLLFLTGPLLVWARRRRLSGCLWFAVPLVIVPLAYYLPLTQGAVGWPELTSVAGEESIGRALSHGWKHVLETPGYFLKSGLMVLPLGFWTLHEHRYRLTRDARMQGDELLLRFCSSSAVVAVLLLAVFPQRPTRYLLPIVPLFLTALGPAVAHYAEGDRPLTAIPRKVLAAIGVLGAVALLVLPFGPYPLPGRSIGLALLLALSPAVASRRQIVGYALLIPLAAAWTAIPDRADHYLDSQRGLRPAAAVLAREVEALRVSDLESTGHVHSALLLYAGLIPSGDERLRREPDAQWLLFEVPEGGRDPGFEGYSDRVRVKVHDRTFALKERR